MSENEDSVNAWLAAAVGEGVEEMAAIARDSGYQVRITSRDGVVRIVTRDYRRDRINFDVTDGKVTRATIG